MPHPEDGERRQIDPERRILSPDQAAALIVRDRFKGVRPADLDQEQFGEVGTKTGIAIRKAVVRLFERLEGNLDPLLLEKLRTEFDANVAIWEEAEIFTPERAARGYKKPDFESDYLPWITKSMIPLMEDGEGLKQGYNTPIWAPMDVPIFDKGPNKPSYLQMLKDALIEACESTTGGKPAHSLLLGPEKRVLTPEEMNLKCILSTYRRIEEGKAVHDISDLGPTHFKPYPQHGGCSEADLLQRLAGLEKKTGGVLRLERDRLVRPADLGKWTLQPQDWIDLYKKGEVFPPQVSPQNIKQALAYAIFCLKTRGWIPDHDTNFSKNEDCALSTRVLAPLTYLPAGDNQISTVASLGWNTQNKYYAVSIHGANEGGWDGIRGGIRINSY